MGVAGQEAERSSPAEFRLIDVNPASHAIQISSALISARSQPKIATHTGAQKIPHHLLSTLQMYLQKRSAESHLHLSLCISMFKIHSGISGH